MQVAALSEDADFAGWRRMARALLARETPPEQVSWVVAGEANLFVEASLVSPLDAGMAGSSGLRVPARFMTLVEALICHRDPQRYALAYRLLWRLTHGERQLMQQITDADVVRARNAEKSVRRDGHKMKAFVRFREVQTADAAGVPESVFIAWFEPEHHIVERVAPFFVRRFTGMLWSILTPTRSAHWDCTTLHYGPGATKADAPREDALEDYWRTYYASIFNPARLKVRAMKSEMPMKYWKNLPEARLIPALIRDAMPRTLAMVDAAASTPRHKIAAPHKPLAAPAAGSLEALRDSARDCRDCPRWQAATGTVFGVGPCPAPLMIVGDQPGDHDDLAGRPFPGPAGRLLDEALHAAGISRSETYVTHAVKHFGFVQRGRLRQPATPSPAEQHACQRWLAAEIELVRPRVILCLGEAAARGVLGPDLPLTQQHGGGFMSNDGRRVWTTTHPAELLKRADPGIRAQAMARWIDDLRPVAAALRKT